VRSHLQGGFVADLPSGCAVFVPSFALESSNLPPIGESRRLVILDVDQEARLLLATARHRFGQAGAPQIK
jgi:hypothetical protein